MHPELIKASIRMKGTTPTALAAKLKVAPTTVFEVISGRTRSARIERAIADLVGQPVSVLWPSHSQPKGVNRRLKSAAPRRVAA
ncbi:MULTISPECIES: helix-turn-helix domain-containing protein [Achromobacter]|nr:MULTISPECIES: helix-turn-helix domain-containing protein [Achromobacter]MCG2597232.1 helix-turn-helix domain-containing protein [Achromobacter sp.]MCG2601809.1 helix-turn-helix domain-containing protein [Achromobacter sp.]MPT37558.1 transcriptional regulator [Achromobacter sp.]PNM90988.1 transcriptional regulator [Achromobacter xylosoxidans]CUI99544.1 Predicted transcriptional regulator [Achromobacter sp. 2789STDY5608621]